MFPGEEIIVSKPFQQTSPGDELPRPLMIGGVLELCHIVHVSKVV